MMPDKKPTARRIRKTPRAETSDKTETSKPAEQPDDNSPEIVSAMNEAVTALAQSLTNIATSLQERQAEHTQKYYAALSAAAPQDDGGQLGAAYKTVLDAVASQDANRIAAAQKAYVDLLTEYMADLTDHSEAATEDYTSNYQELVDTAQNQGRDQYFAYVDTLRTVLNKASDDALPPATLTMLVQNMASAAMLSQGLFPAQE